MATPKSEHVAALIETSLLSNEPTAATLARYTRNLLARLSDDITTNATMKRRGHQGQAKALEVLSPMIEAYADAVAASAPKAPAEPIVCTAQNQLGAVCMRTDAGHTAHTYPPVNPADRVPPLAQPVPDPTGTATCGMTYPGSADPCLLDPTHVPKRESHQARNSRWPVSDTDLAIYNGDAEEAARLAIYEPLNKVHASDKEQILAFLRGETDELGTPPLFIEPRGEIVVTNMATGEQHTEPLPAPVTPDEFVLGINNPQITSGGPSGYVELGLSDQIVIPGNFQGHPFTDSKPLSELLEAAVQPDPFADAGVVPDSQIRRDYSWRPEPDPRPLWLPPEGLPGQPFTNDLLRSIRVTAVRTGEQCGMAYRLISRDQVPEVPAWWNVGGHTLHACAQAIEETIIAGAPAAEISDGLARTMWEKHWPEAVALTERESPGFERRHWRAANKGTEGADWWNEVGPHMVRDYAAASAQWHSEGWSILTVPSPPYPMNTPMQLVHAMELEMRSPLPTGGELVGHLDQAWFRITDSEDGQAGAWEIRIRDLKTGKDMPTDEWQLDAYTYLLYQRLRESGTDLSRCSFSVVHYDARNGKDAEVRKIDIAQQPIAIQTVYRASSVLRMHEANNYPASPGGTWRDPCYLCAVRYACPIMALKS